MSDDGSREGSRIPGELEKSCLDEVFVGDDGTTWDLFVVVRLNCAICVFSFEFPFKLLSTESVLVSAKPSDRLTFERLMLRGRS